MMHMDEEMSMVPWLDQPVMLHSSRDPGECTMTPEQCAYKLGYWRNWYQADHRFALPTVAFFLVAIGIFSIAHIVTSISPPGVKRSPVWQRAVAICRYLSYKSWRIAGWNSQSLGVFLLGAAGLVFFLGMSSTITSSTSSQPPHVFPSHDSGAAPLLLAQHQGA